MKKLILSLVIAVFFLILSVIIIGIIKKTRLDNASEIRISNLPVFSLPALNGGSFSTSEIEAGPVLLVRFHPECEHCRHEMNEIFKNEIADKEVLFLLISSASKNDVEVFLSQYDIKNKENVIALTDTAYVLSDIFSKNVIPSNYIYGNDLKLVKALYGEYKIETIMKYLEIGE